MTALGLDHYSQLTFIGAGKFGKVYRAVDHEGNVRALKILWEGSPDALENLIRNGGSPPKFSEAFEKQFREEVQLLRSLSEFSIQHLGRSYVTRLYDAQIEADRLQYLATDFVQLPVITDIIRERRDAGASPIIPEVIALDITRVFLQLLAYLHRQKLHLLDIQLKNYCIATPLPENPDALLPDLMILDWNGVKTFDEAIEHSGYSYPQSYDIRAAIAFLFEMLTGYAVKESRTLTPTKLREFAGAHWENISEGTRILFADYLGLQAGQFNVSADQVVGEIAVLLERWRGGHMRIPTREAEVRARQVSTDDLRDGLWFASHFGLAERARAFEDLFQTLGLSAAKDVSIYLAAIRDLNDGRIFAATGKLKNETRLQAMSLGDLRWHLALQLLDKYVDERWADALGVGIVGFLSQYPAGESNAESWKAVAARAEGLAGQAMQPDVVAFFRRFVHEAQVRARWLCLIEGVGVSLAGFYENPASLTDSTPEVYAALLEALQGFRGCYQAWASVEPESIHRLQVGYELLQRPWNEDVETPPEILGWLEALEADVGREQVAMAALEAVRRRIDDAAQAGDIVGLRQAIREATLSLPRERKRWLEEAVSGAIDILLRSKEMVEDTLRFAEGREGDLTSEVSERVRQFGAARVLAERIVSRGSAVDEQALAAIMDGDAQEYLMASVNSGLRLSPPVDEIGGLGAAVERHQAAQRTRELPHEIEAAPSYEALRPLVSEAVSLGGLLGDGAGVAAALREVHELREGYERRRNDAGGIGRARKDGEQREALKQELIGLNRAVTAAREGLGELGSKWLDDTKGIVNRDLPEVDTRSRLAQQRGFIISGMLVILLIGAVAFLFTRQSSDDLNVTATAAALALQIERTQQAVMATAQAQLLEATLEAEQTRLAQGAATSNANFTQVSVAVQITLNAINTRAATTPTPTLTPTETLTPTPTETPTLTPTETPTPTFTPTLTPTPSDTPTPTLIPTLSPLNSTQTQAANYRAETEVFLQETQVSVDLTLTAESELVATLETSDCRVRLVPNTSARVFEDPRDLRTSTPPASGLLSPQNQPLVVGRALVRDDNWLQITGLDRSDIGIRPEDRPWVRQNTVEFIDSEKCDPFLLPTITPTPTLTNTPMATETLSF